VRTFFGQGGINFSRFCVDVLWTAPFSNEIKINYKTKNYFFRDIKLPYDDATDHLSVKLGTAFLRDERQGVRILVRRIFPHPTYDIHFFDEVVYGKLVQKIYVS